MKKSLSVALALFVFAAVAQAERPPQSRDDAKLVVSGTVKTITTKESSFGGDGVRTDYTAEVVLDSVDRGEKVKAGDTITVTWFHVTKRPTGFIAGAFGHGYALKEKDKAKFWLLDRGPGVPRGAWVVIYNKNGVEKIDK
jgi:hypothetical protein